MGPGHFGIGLAVKPAIPKVPLWVLLVASEALDLLSFGFLAIGWEKMAVIDTDFSQGLSILTPLAQFPGYMGCSCQSFGRLLLGCLPIVFTGTG